FIGLKKGLKKGTHLVLPEQQNEMRPLFDVELDNEVIRCFQDYAWPGNVRELKNAIDRILAKARPGESLLTFETLRERFSDLELPMLHRTGAVLPPPSTSAGQLSADLIEKLRGGNATIWSAVGTGYTDQIRGSLKALLNHQGLSLLQDLDQRLFPYA